MNRCTKKWLLSAAVLVAVGAILFVGALIVVKFDFARISTQKFQTNTYEFSEDFESISVTVETAAVKFAPSDNDMCKVVCLEEEKLRHSVKIEDGILHIDVIDSRKWFNFIGINFQTPTVTVYLPKDVYTSLSVDTVTGNIEIPDRYSFETVMASGTTSNISCCASVSKSIELSTTAGNIIVEKAKPEAVKMSSTTGNVTVKEVTCGNLTAKSSTGVIKLQNVVANESIKAENTTGGVRFEGCDASKITIKTGTGDVKGTLLSEKIFVTKTSTGRVSVPQSTSGGKCEITTSTGDIKIELG